MKADLFIWRPIVAKLLRYSDLEKMSVGDLLDAHEVLDIQEHMKEKELKALERRRFIKHG